MKPRASPAGVRGEEGSGKIAWTAADRGDNTKATRCYFVPRPGSEMGI